MLITAFHDKPLGIYCFYVVLNVFKLHNSLLVDIVSIIAHCRELLGDFFGCGLYFKYFPAVF